MESKKTYNDILTMIVDACRRNFTDGVENKEQTIIECATKIYIEQVILGKVAKLPYSEEDLEELNETGVNQNG